MVGNMGKDLQKYRFWCMLKDRVMCGKKVCAVLQLIMGRSGYGKTYAVTEEIVRCVEAGESGIVVLVPEQASFETERALLRRLGAARAGAVQVLSFTRLAETVARECGGMTGKMMDKVTRTLLMSRALEQMKERLTLYRRHAARADYVQAVLDVLAECKQYAVTPHRLETAAATLPEGTLRQKLEELACIMDAYEALAADSYMDPADALTHLVEQLPRSRFGEGALLLVDGFRGFTEQEMQVMALLMRRAARTVITLCTDTLDTRDEYALFAPVTRTAARFVQMARDNGVAIAEPRYLTENHRAQNAALRTLEAGCFADDSLPLEEETAAVAVAGYTDRYAECRAVANEIRRLMREDGVRCRDIAIVARNLADYDGVLDVALARADIPFFMDRREDVYTEPLMALMQSALAVVSGGFAAEPVLRVMKTGLAGFAASSIARVENYVFVWKLSGRRLREEWTANPDGLEEMTDKGRAQLRHLNRLRRRLLTPLEHLADSLRGDVTGQTFARAMYRYLEEAKVARLVRLQAKRLRAARDPAAAERMETMWELLMGILDRFGTALGTVSLSAARLDELFALALAATDRGSIPQGLDAVQIGSAERMRFAAPRAVWILGANEGVFPAYPATGGLITDRERQALSEIGVTLSETGDRQAVEEQLYAYLAVAAPSERLYVSYIESVSGEAMPPSALVAGVVRCLPCRVTQEAEVPETDDEAFRALAEQFEDFTARRAALQAYFADHPQYAAQLRAMERAAAHQTATFSSSEAAGEFFGKHMTLSASQVETYYQCRFRYFCQYGLRVRPLRPAELGSLEFGNLAHFVMETVLPRYVATQFRDVTRAAVTEDTAAAVTMYVDTVMGGAADKSARFITQTGRLCRTVGALLWHVVQELRQSRFVPTEYELAVGMDDGVNATVLTLPDGATVRVVGKIDRVDVYHAGETAYVRVVDYKTGAKNFRLDEVVEGINLQMLLYLFSLWDNAGDRYGGAATPAGVLYLPAKLPVVAVAAGDSEEERARARLKVMQMNGLLLNDPEVISAMEADGQGIFIPAKLKADGTPDSRAAVATLAQFGQLKKRAEVLLRDMAATLRRGDVAAIPAGSERLDACAFCDYAAVCGREAGDTVREIKTYDTKAVLAMLSEDDEEENEKM